jgi:hypothetical protein
MISNTLNVFAAVVLRGVGSLDKVNVTVAVLVMVVPADVPTAMAEWAQKQLRHTAAVNLIHNRKI